MTFLLSLLGIGKTIGTWLKAIPWQVYAIIGALLICFFAVRAWDKHIWNEGYNSGWVSQQKPLRQCASARAIDEQSITTLQGVVAAKNAESEARAKALADSQAQDAANQKRFDALQKADSGRVAALQNLAKDLPTNPGCTVPAALSAQLDGL